MRGAYVMDGSGNSRGAGYTALLLASFDLDVDIFQHVRIPSSLSGEEPLEARHVQPQAPSSYGALRHPSIPRCRA